MRHFMAAVRESMSAMACQPNERQSGLMKCFEMREIMGIGAFLAMTPCSHLSLIGERAS